MVKITLEIEGMACSMCEAHINEAIRKSCPIKKVTSSHRKGLTEIIAQESLNEDALRKAVEDTGYRLLSTRQEPYQKKGLFSLGR